MTKMLRFELRKLFRQKAIYICSIIIALSAFSSIYTMNQLFNEDELHKMSYSATNCLTNALENGSLLIVLSIFIPIFICADSKLGTLKNIYAKGFSRTKVFLAKYIVTLFTTVVYCSIAYAVTYVTALHFFGNDAEILDNFNQSIIAELAVVMAYHTLYFGLSIIIEKSGIVIGINAIGFQLVSVLIFIVDHYLENADLDFEFSKYWIESVYTKISEVPFPTENYSFILKASIIYIVVSLIVSGFINSKKQL